MKRTNPRKGRDEDPGFVPISWDEALDTVASKLRTIKGEGLLDEAGMPRVAASFGHGGTPAMYMGTFPAFLAAEMARGVLLHGRSRYEIPWQEMTTLKQSTFTFTCGVLYKP